MSVVAVIPARYASTRFPGKPLVDLAGKPMIQHVYEQASRSQLLSRVIVATDDQRIFDAVRSFGGEVVMTRDDHPSGTDRLAEVAAGLDADIIVNVQGDEPLIDPEMIDSAVRPLVAEPQIVMGTLKSRIRDAAEVINPNVVKVVTDRHGFALYFSRSPIPFDREPGGAAVDYYKHIGLYVYRRDFLLDYAALAETPLEQTEKLEQLRVLENGFRIYVAETDLESIGVDAPDDVARVLEEMCK